MNQQDRWRMFIIYGESASGNILRGVKNTYLFIFVKFFEHLHIENYSPFA